jgi:peptide/nickel transport system permease protein
MPEPGQDLQVSFEPNRPEPNRPEPNRPEPNRPEPPGREVVRPSDQRIPRQSRIGVHRPNGERAEFAVRSRSQTAQVVSRFLAHRMATVSLFVFILLVLFAWVGPLVWHYDYTALTNDFGAAPSGAHPFGTDLASHDALALTMRGTQHSLLIAFTLTAIAMTGGIAFGAMAGFYGGLLDTLFMRIADLMLTIPVVAIAAALSAGVGGAGHGSWWTIGVILGLLSVPYVARLVRGMVLSLREKEFVESARALGASDTRILVRHLIPNALGPVLVLATISVAAGVLAETGLSAIGFGVSTPDTSLGLQITLAAGTMDTRPWMFYIPGIFIVLIALTINFVGDGLRDAFDPRQAKVRR